VKSRVLVVEDGREYFDNLTRFLGGDFDFARAGDGLDAIEMFRAGGREGERCGALLPQNRSAWDAVFLDMRFDRALRLLGDAEGGSVGATLNDRDRRYLAENQGAIILGALRSAGARLPVLFSYDFDAEPRRFANLSRRYGPLAYLPDSAGPAAIREALFTLIGTPR
jgi:hypothetical protein